MSIHILKPVSMAMPSRQPSKCGCSGPVLQFRNHYFSCRETRQPPDEESSIDHAVAKYKESLQGTVPCRVDPLCEPGRTWWNLVEPCRNQVGVPRGPKAESDWGGGCSHASLHTSLDATRLPLQRRLCWFRDLCRNAACDVPSVIPGIRA